MEEIEVEAGVWFKRGCSIIWDNRCLTRLVKDNSEITPISTALRKKLRFGPRFGSA